ncbi:MAG: ATP-binding protein, partial [Rudaea sp.]
YLANYCELQGDFQGARRWAARQLEIDAWREEAHRQIMRVLAAQGDRSGALVQYENCRRILARDLGIEPSAETRTLYDQIKRGEPMAQNAQPVRPGPALTPLPVPGTPFIGRERELDEIEQQLSDPACRLLTLVGPGGAGKTRLALQSAVNLKDKYANGAAFVPLAQIDSVDLIPAAIANGVGLAFSGSQDPKVQVLNFLRTRELLLILDNVEHLQEGAEFFRELLDQARDVQVILTSREPLNLLGEWVFEVGGLDLPAADAETDLEQWSAVALFLQRAQRAHVGAILGAEQQQTVARICRLVGGMPLAIELAAGWVRTLAPEEIEQEIERNVDFLTGTMRDLPERHRSMRAVFDHSWRLLGPEEQSVLARLSIFRGGFQRDAAEAVARASLPLLSTLINKSFLRRLPSGRYDLHELVRQYAAERLRENSEEEAAARDRHSEYYVTFAANLENELKGPGQLEALAEMTREMENIRNAWRHAVMQRRIEWIRMPIRAFWSIDEMRGWFQEGQALFGWAGDELQPVSDSPGSNGRDWQVLLSQIRSKQGWFAVRLGKREVARQLLEASTATLRSLGAKIELVHSLHHLGVLQWQAGDLEGARASFLEELAVATEIQDPWEIALANGNLGIATQSLGEKREALERFETALNDYRRIGDQRMVAVGLFYLGGIQGELGMYGPAQESLRGSIERGTVVGEPWLLGMALSALADVLVQSKGDLREAVGLYRKSLMLFEQVGERWSTIVTLNQLGAALFASHRDDEAGEVFRRALALATQTQLMPGILNALAGMAEWHLKKGRCETALLILTKVLDEPSLVEPSRERAQRTRSEAVQGMRQDEITGALHRAKDMSLEALAKELDRDIAVPLNPTILGR